MGRFASLSLPLALLVVIAACVSAPKPEQACERLASCTDLCGVQDDGCGGTIDCGVCTNTEELMLAMGDGVRLRTKVFRPVTEGEAGATFPAILYRTPFRSAGTEDARFERLARFYVGRGFAFVLQDCRGTHGSDGAFYPMRAEAADGKATTEWMAAQSWCTGEIATMGVGYEAYAALAAAVDNPLVKAVIADEPPDGMAVWNEAGLPSVGLLRLVGQDDVNDEVAMVRSATNALDLHLLDLQLIGRSDAAFRDALAHPTPSDPVWDSSRLTMQAGQICAPVLILQGQTPMWDHPLQIATSLWSNGCAAAHDNVRLVLGQFAHGVTVGSVLNGLQAPATQLMLDTLDELLLHRDTGLAGVPLVQLDPGHGIGLVAATAWPPAGAEARTYYLSGTGTGTGAGTTTGQGTLALAPPYAEAPSELTVDPANVDPCAEDIEAGLMFSTSAFTEATLIAGQPQLTLYFSTSAADADLFVSLYDHDPHASTPEAEYTLIGSGGLRARYRDGFATPAPLPADTPVALAVPMSATAWQVGATHSLVLMVTGAQCGTFENPHTGEPLTGQTHYALSRHRVHHDPDHLSKLVLPILATP